MTTLTATHLLPSTNAFGNLSEAFQKFFAYRRTLAELRALSDRNLSDLGISRAMIADFAHAAVYGS